MKNAYIRLCYNCGYQQVLKKPEPFIGYFDCPKCRTSQTKELDLVDAIEMGYFNPPTIDPMDGGLFI